MMGYTGFFMTKIKYLGQIIDENGKKPATTRKSEIKNMPSLKNPPSLDI